MPEATVILFDNSEFMRNADYIPSRLGAQVDTVGMIAQAKCDSNPENTVAMVSTSKRPTVVLTLTYDVAKVFTSTDKIPLEGTVDIINSFRVASLLLNHRANKVHHQRIIALIGSPVLPEGVSEEAFMKQIEAVGRDLKSAHVALDIVSFGEVEQNEPFLRALFQIVCGDDPSLGVFLTVNPGTKLISDCVMCSPIVLGEAAGGAGGAPAAAAAASSGAAFGDFGAYGYEDDPELAFAIAESLREEQERLERLEKANKEKEAPPAAQPAQSESDAIMADEDLAAVLQMTAGLQTPTPASKQESAPGAPVKKTDAKSDDSEMKDGANSVFTPDFEASLLAGVNVDPTILLGTGSASSSSATQEKDDKKKKDEKDDDTKMTDQ